MDHVSDQPSIGLPDVLDESVAGVVENVNPVPGPKAPATYAGICPVTFRGPLLKANCLPCHLIGQR